MNALRVYALPPFGEIVSGDDLSGLITANLVTPLKAHDVVVVTSKVVSKAAGLVTSGDREALIDDETETLVAQRGATRIVRTRHGLTLAAAGLDASNTEAGTVVSLPPFPDRDASVLRAKLIRRHPDTAGRLGIIITDTAGRPWRTGQTDIAIGVAGLHPLRSYAGTHDPHGNELRVTSPAIADEVAGAADLTTGKVSRTPVAIVDGLDPEYFTDDDGPGAATLVRAASEDLFGLGAHEAVRAALSMSSTRPPGFADVDTPDDLAALVVAAVDSAALDIELVPRRDRPTIHVRPAHAATRDRALVALGALQERVRILDRVYCTALAADVHLQGFEQPET